MKKTIILVLCSTVVAGTAMADEAARRKASYDDAFTPRTTDCNNATALAGGLYTVADGETWFFSYTGNGLGLDLQTCSDLTDFDTDMSIIDNCTDLNELYYRDGASGCGWATYLECDEFLFEDGVDYIIAIYPYNLGTGGTFELTIGDPCDPPAGPPANDNMMDAEMVTVGTCVDGSTDGATQDNFPPLFQHACYTGFYSATSTGNAPDVWYSFMSDGGCYSVSLCGSDYDTSLALFDATGAPLASDDDECSLQSEIVSYSAGCWLPAGMIYVAVDGYSSNTGDFTLCIDACTPSDANDLPVAFELGQAFPNPFNPSTTIEFSMNETASASLKVFNMAGQEVATLIDGTVERGENSVVFDASGLTSGVYFYSLEANGLSQTRKMVLLK